MSDKTAKEWLEGKAEMVVPVPRTLCHISKSWLSVSYDVALEYGERRARVLRI